MRSFLFLLLTIQAFLVGAQMKGSDKLYGYKEAVIPGMNPSYTDENGGQKSGTIKSSSNYFIYVQSDARIYPSEMWVEGQPYSVAVTTVTTPVERVDESQPASPVVKTLVPKTTQRVIQLITSKAVHEKFSKIGKGLAEKNELVVVYKKGGKFYYISLASLTALEPAVKQ
jgi:hypothetical protein